MSSDNWRPAPELHAHSFSWAFCSDPNCGLHVVAMRSDSSPICEIVMSPQQTRMVVESCKDFLYDKATRKDDNQ